MHLPSLSDWITIGIIGLLLFGERLPKVAQSFGKLVAEFKKELSSIAEELEKAAEAPSADAAPLSSPKHDAADATHGHDEGKTG